MSAIKSLLNTLLSLFSKKKNPPPKQNLGGGGGPIEPG